MKVFLTIREAARYIGKTENWLRKDKTIPRISHGAGRGKMLIFRTSDLDVWKTNQQQQKHRGSLMSKKYWDDFGKLGRRIKMERWAKESIDRPAKSSGSEN